MAYTGVWLTLSQLAQQERGQVIVPPKFGLPPDWTFVPRDRKRKAETSEVSCRKGNCSPASHRLGVKCPVYVTVRSAGPGS